MKRWLASTAFALCTFTGAVIAQECEEPAEVALPDGAAASTEEMVAGQQAVKQYIADGEEFLGCMEAFEQANIDELTDEQKKANVERYNAVVDKLQQVAQGFNEQIKAYKEAQAE